MTKASYAGEELIGSLGPHEGLRRFVVHGQIVVDRVPRSRVLRWMPRRSYFSVSNANQRSTRLIQEAPFAVKCR